MHIVLLDNGRSKIAADPLFSQIFRCVRCGACANVCPVFRMVGGHRMGHIYIGAIGLVLTYLFHDRSIAKTLCQNCIGCGACKDVCSGGIDLPALIREIRARFSKEDGAPMPAKLASLAMRDRKVFHTLLKFMRFSHRPVAGSDGFVRHLPMALFGKHGFKSLPAFAPKAFRELWPSLQRRPERPRLKIALFAGCAQDFVYPQHLVAAMKVFAAAEVEVEFPMEQTCCGLPLAMLGENETAKTVAQQNIAALSGEYDAIVTLCASCASHLKHGYRELLGDDAASFSEKVIDFSSFVHDRIGLSSLKLKPSGEKVAYHASCHLCRGLGVKDAPRALIAAAANYAPTAEEESCCGFGGTFSAKFPEISAELMRKKLANATATGAKRIALDCPGCAMQLGGGADRMKLDVRVSHVAELLAEALRKAVTATTSVGCGR
jgi:Fe-S oxidoreductase